jgi:hypothetical protein
MGIPGEDAEEWEVAAPAPFTIPKRVAEPEPAPELPTIPTPEEEPEREPVPA